MTTVSGTGSGTVTLHTASTNGPAFAFFDPSASGGSFSLRVGTHDLAAKATGGNNPATLVPLLLTAGDVISLTVLVSAGDPWSCEFRLYDGSGLIDIA